jgi:hypothetical protein
MSNYTTASTIKEVIKVAAVSLSYAGIVDIEQQADFISSAIDDCRVNGVFVIKVLEDCWTDIGSEECPNLVYMQTSTSFVERLLDEAQ